MNGSTSESKSVQDPQENLLAQGDILLKQLDQEAAAARAEAKRIELQRLMAQARQGNVSPLQEWLEQNRHGQNRHGREVTARVDSGIPSDSTHPGPPADTGESSPSPPPNSWDAFRVAANGRLLERHSRILGNPSRPSVGKAARAVVETESTANDGSDKLKRPAKKEAQEPSVKEKQRLQALAKQLAAPNSEEEEQRKAAQKRGALFSRLGGAGVSAVAHVLLILVLAFITLKAPATNAGMSFEASATSTEEPVELTQPLEVETPDIAEPTTETEVSTNFDLSDTIQAAAPSDALGNLGPVGDALSPAAAMSSAVQSSAVPNMTGSKFFGAAAGGNNFCYVIDGSGSMRGGPWEAAKFELFKSLDSLKPKQRFYIIFFGRDFEAISRPGERDPAPASLYATPENIQHARQWVNGLDFVQGGPPINAIEFAIEKEPDAIYLLTDGVTAVKTVAQQIRSFNVIEDLINGAQVRSPIHAISFYSLEGERLMRQIASENKGQFIYVPDPRKR